MKKPRVTIFSPDRKQLITIDRKMLGRRIAEVRVANHMKQTDIAKALKPKVTRAAVSLWEKGTSVPDYETLEQIAKLFGVTTDWLVSGQGKHPGQIGEVEFGVGDAGPYSPEVAIVDWWQVPPHIISDLRADASALRIYHNHTDTMEPKIKRGAYVVVDTKCDRPIHGETFCLHNGVSHILKTLVVDPNDSKRIGLKDGKNGYSETQFIPMKRLKLIGRCVAQFAAL